MIFYLVTRQHSYTVAAFANDWEPSIGLRMRVLYYEDLPSLIALAEHPRGIYVFSDLERLAPYQVELAATLWTTLSRSGCRLLNHPIHSFRRLQLLQTLYERGENAFQAYRLSETTYPARYPVFLRFERSHEISSPLLDTPEQLALAINDNLNQGHSLHELLMVEYLDTPDSQGVYRKYGATFIGGQVVPHDVLFNTSWMVRPSDDIVREEQVQEERQFLISNPHQGWLRRIFRMANIEYGRMDYSFLNGRPQAWEINTNPLIVSNRHRPSSMRLENRKLCARLHREAFEAIDSEFAHATGVTAPTTLNSSSSV
jgi:hypothetical protein